jgi:hypothetical protein
MALADDEGRGKLVYQRDQRIAEDEEARQREKGRDVAR